MAALVVPRFIRYMHEGMQLVFETPNVEDVYAYVHECVRVQLGLPKLRMYRVAIRGRDGVMIVAATNAELAVFGFKAGAYAEPINIDGLKDKQIIRSC